MEKLNVKLDVFEGPLDLLLHLIKTLEIDIYDIAIAERSVQYMEYIRTMKLLQLEVAGDFIVMAATLMSIKSKMLLPKQELQMDDDSEYEEEEDDPRADLVAQLLEYRKYKYAATVLHELEEERGQYYTKEPSNLEEYQEEIVPLETGKVNTIDLFLAFHEVLERKKRLTPMETTIVHDTTTIEDKMNHIRMIVEGIEGTDGVAFDCLFQDYSKSEIVTTFMALLELIKGCHILAKQENNYEPIMLYRHHEFVVE